MHSCEHSFKKNGMALIGGLLASIFLSLPISAEELTAQDVMKFVDTVENGNLANANLVMLLVDEAGSKKQREFNWQRKDAGVDSKSRIIFKSPADLKGTGFVGWNWAAADKDDDSWLCLPSLHKCKRIANEAQSGAFLGTDFSFYDINGLNISDWDFSFINSDDTYDNQAAWLIEAIPKAAIVAKVEEKTGYKKFQVWVGKENHLIVKGRYWLTQATKEKYFFAKNVKKMDGIWTIMQQQMISSERGKQTHSTVIQIQDIKYNIDTPDSVFTTDGLQLEW